jgi:hypothetical protein
MRERPTPGSWRRRASLSLIAMVPLASSFMNCTSSNPKGERQDDLIILPPRQPAEVNGSLYLGSGGDDVAGIFSDKGKEKIFVPDLLVALKQAATGTTVATTKTDLSGHY